MWREKKTIKKKTFLLYTWFSKIIQRGTTTAPFYTNLLRYFTTQKGMWKVRNQTAE